MYEVLSEAASESVPGARGLVFLPYLSGERCPYADPNLRGAFVGLSLTSTKADVIRSVMEGVVLSLRDVRELFSEMGMSFSSVSTSGGGSQSSLWRQIHADVFQNDVVTVNGSREGAAYGAAMVAAVGSRVWGDFDVGTNKLRVENRATPNKELSDLYERLYGVYHGLHDALKPSFDSLAQIE